MDASKDGGRSKAARPSCRCALTISYDCQTHASEAYYCDTEANWEIAEGWLMARWILRRSIALKAGSSENQPRDVIAATPKNGGSATSWPNHLILSAIGKHPDGLHGHGLGRMRWNDPAPTMTTQFMTWDLGALVVGRKIARYHCERRRFSDLPAILRVCTGQSCDGEARRETYRKRCSCVAGPRYWRRTSREPPP